MKPLFASLLLLAACAPRAPVEAPAPVSVEMIEFRVSSWGKPVSEWRIQPSGAATYTHAEGPGLGTRLVTRKFDAGPQGFARIRTLLAPAEAVIGAQPECGERWTDFPYGSIRWYTGLIQQGIAFDLGCKNPRLTPIHDAVGAAEKQMADWSKTGQIIEDKEMNP
ncbi:hypothetical protein P6144_07855 [Sphingomonas sp. HITSZ_GF]|uniref:hypothetical protein n=1 Tax=Sphingomonas sp. HITSZ_GF TaxID=3037247 RepID=UPI00240D2A77|nr:hypothetical protein [Sphingomonas sp. HITSZ_GF]MDG2533555.1 hypothetical protein [Sphingomonas sp. HITSZ_GF]